MKIYTDGGCCYQSKVGSWAYVADGNLSDCGLLLNTTSNRAELIAIIKAMLFSLKTNNKQIEIYSDSLLTVNCGKGIWKRKANKDLWIEFDKVKSNLDKLELSWIKRDSHELNTLADSYCRDIASKNGVIYKY